MHNIGLIELMAPQKKPRGSRGKRRSDGSLGTRTGFPSKAWPP